MDWTRYASQSISPEGKELLTSFSLMDSMSVLCSVTGCRSGSNGFTGTMMSENVNIQDCLNATTWKRSKKDENLVRFGHLWKLYDMAAGWKLSPICIGSLYQGRVPRMVLLGNIPRRIGT